MASIVSVEDAAALVKPTDTIASGLACSWPPELMRVLGERDDWEDLRISGGHMAVETELPLRNGVSYRSYFHGPNERKWLRAGAAIEFVPSDFRRFTAILKKHAPRVMLAACAPPDNRGWCSLSLQAGASIPELRAAAADPERLLIVETSENFPRTRGLPPEFRHALHLDEIDVLIEGSGAPHAIPGREPDEIESAIAAHATAFIGSGSTLQTGVGAVPQAIAECLANGPHGDFGIQSEVFNDGLMMLHEAGKVSNARTRNPGISVTTFALGSRDLYDWLHENDDVAFLPVEQINDPFLTAQNPLPVTINCALEIDLYGQIVADALPHRQFSGVGGAEDFVSGPAYSEGGRSLMCLRATAVVNGEVISKITAQHPAGAVITTPRHQPDVIVTEYGAAEIEGLSAAERGAALAQIAHPDFRDLLIASSGAVGNHPEH
jgi:acyl-CoA hydrolase